MSLVQTFPGGKGGSIQVNTLPTASASVAGKIYQYIGSTTSSYTHGYFYECVLQSGVYKWVNSPTQDTPSVSDKYDVNDTAETTIADGDYFPFYDVSASEKRKTLFSNLVDKIKTMTGAQASAAGAKGLVPAPAAGDNTKYLRGDGTWQTITTGGSSVLTGTLTSSGWSNGTQTVSVTGITANTKGVVGLLDTATSAQITAAATARIRPTTLATNSITFACENTPSVNIPFGVLVTE